jgi:hypothetical protein
MNEYSWNSLIIFLREETPGGEVLETFLFKAQDFPECFAALSIFSFIILKLFQLFGICYYRK